MSEEADLYLECISCGAMFTWESGEQRFYASKNLASPRRCRSCAKARRQELDSTRESNTREGR
jgi:hypothetical protein